MQGKFQMVVVRHTGHAIQVFTLFQNDKFLPSCGCYYVLWAIVIVWTVQEDTPDEFSNLILNFISRNRIGPHGVEVSIKFHSCYCEMSDLLSPLRKGSDEGKNEDFICAQCFLPSHDVKRYVADTRTSQTAAVATFNWTQEKKIICSFASRFDLSD